MLSLSSFFIFVYPVLVVRYLLTGDFVSTLQVILQTLIISFLLAYYFRTTTTFYPLRLFAYEGLGLGFIAFWIANLSLLAFFILNVNSQLIGYISIFIILLLFLYSQVNARLIFFREVFLHTKKVCKDYCLILISDIHLGSNNKKYFERLIYKINKVEADAILISGDLIDSSSFNLTELNLFKTINIPIFFVTGNHEFYLKNSKEKLNKLKDYNIKTIDNKNTSFKEFNIIGIADHIPLEAKIKFAKSRKKSGQFNICLVHQPSIWDAIRDDVDLMFSGHTHNGQIFPFNFFVKLKFKYVYGQYKYKNNSLLVSSGAGTWGPKMRLGSFNEIIKLNIKRAF